MADDPNQPQPDRGTQPEPQPDAEPGPGRFWRRRASRINKGLDQAASTISSVQTILTLVGAVLAGLALLNRRLGVLPSLNVVFHNLTASIYRAKVPLLAALLLAAALNVVWVLRKGRSQRWALQWVPLAVTLLLALGVAIIRPVPFNVAILTFGALDADTQAAGAALGTELATMLAGDMENRGENITAVVASQDDRTMAGLEALAEDKGVDFVVDGAYALAGPNLRVEANVFNARTDEYLLDQPIQRFDLRDNAGGLQAGVAEEIVAALPLYSGVRAASAQPSDPNTCASAYECYLRGRQYYRWFSLSGYQQAAEAFRAALAHEPDYALALAGLADALTFLAADMTYLGEFDQASAVELEAAQAARRALELEPDSLEALRSAAFLNIYRRFGREEADALVSRLEQIAPDDAETHWLRGLTAPTAEESLAQFEQAVDLAPDLMIAQEYLGDQLRQIGRPEEALPHLEAALRHNPYALRAYRNLGWAYLALDRPAEAETQARLALQLEPRYQDAQYLLGFALGAQGSTLQAVQLLQELLATAPEQGAAVIQRGYAQPADYEPMIRFFEGLRSRQPEFVHVYNELGNTYRSAGRLDEAEASYREALRRDPSLAVARYNLASLLAHDRGDFTAAEPESARVVEELPDFGAAHQLRALILQELGRYVQAESEMQRALELGPDAPGLYFDLAGLYLDMDRPEAARAQFEKVRAAEPAEAYPYNLWANLLSSKGHYDEAIAAYQEAIARNSNNPAYFRNLAETQRKAGDLDEALENCRKAIDMAPTSVLDSYLICGQVALDRGDLAEAERYARDGLAIVPTNYSLHILLGTTLAELGRHEEADQAFEAAVQYDAHGIQALNEWAKVLDARGDPWAAIEKYEEARSQRPFDARLLANLADSYREIGQLDPALSTIQEAVGLQPDVAWGHKVYADILRDQGARNEALAHYQEAQRLEPQAVEHLADLAMIYEELGEPEKADAAYRDAAELDPNDSITFNDWGLFLLAQGRLEEAAAKLKLALGLSPEDPIILANLGDILLYQENAAEAEPYLRRAVELAPDDDYALASLGEALLDLDRGEEAVTMLSAAAQLAPDVLRYQLALARALIEMGDLEGAAAALRRGAELAPDNPEIQELQRVLDERTQP